MAVVVGFSSDAASSPRTESWLLPILTGLAPWATSAQLEALHWLVRKIAHLSSTRSSPPSGCAPSSEAAA